MPGVLQQQRLERNRATQHVATVDDEQAIGLRRKLAAGAQIGDGLLHGVGSGTSSHSRVM